MADMEKKGSDWTAGIIAIVATLLFATAAPIALYFLVYKPQTERHKAQISRRDTAQSNLTLQLERDKQVQEYEREGQHVEKWLTAFEEQFPGSKRDSKGELPFDRRGQIINELQNMAAACGLKGQRTRSTSGNLDMVRSLDQPVGNPEILQGDVMVVRCTGHFHHFCKFIEMLESFNISVPARRNEDPTNFEPVPVLENPLYIVRGVRVEGNNTAGNIHKFEIEVVALKPRDIAKLGR